MFDTNVFNRILDGIVSLHSFGEHIIPYATHIQRDELQNTKDIKRREALLQIFHEAITASIETESLVMDASKLDGAKLSENRMKPTSSGVLGTSKWGEFMWSGSESLLPVLRAELDSMETKPNNVQDALIADTAIRGSYVLVTDDKALVEVTKKHGGRCFSVSELSQQSLQQHEGGNDGAKR